MSGDRMNRATRSVIESERTTSGIRLTTTRISNSGARSDVGNLSWTCRPPPWAWVEAKARVTYGIEQAAPSDAGNARHVEPSVKVKGLVQASVPRAECSPALRS